MKKKLLIFTPFQGYFWYHYSSMSISLSLSGAQLIHILNIIFIITFDGLFRRPSIARIQQKRLDPCGALHEFWHWRFCHSARILLQGPFYSPVASISSIVCQVGGVFKQESYFGREVSYEELLGFWVAHDFILDEKYWRVKNKSNGIIKLTFLIDYQLKWLHCLLKLNL